MHNNDKELVGARSLAPEPRNMNALGQQTMIELLAVQVDGYTGGNSSVRAETARSLLQGLQYLVRLGAGKLEADASATGAAYVQQGLAEARRRVEKGRRLLEEAAATMAEIPHKSYRETIAAMESFFTNYNVYYLAHDIPCVLDYPLAEPVSEQLLGIDYINTYLEHLIAENAFVACFDVQTVTALLRCLDSTFEDGLTNICAEAARQAAVLAVTGGDIRSLDVTDSDRHKLAGLFKERGPSAWQQWQETSAALCTTLGVDGYCDYIERVALAQYPFVENAVHLDMLEQALPSLETHEEQPVAPLCVIGNPPMADDALRALIDALSDCPSAAEKAALVRQEVRSLHDLTQVLSISFWDEEADVLFETLEPSELTMLEAAVHRHQQEMPDWQSETGWELRLQQYPRSQDNPSRHIL